MNTQVISRAATFVLKSPVRGMASGGFDVLLSIASISAKRGSPERVNSDIRKDHSV